MEVLEGQGNTVLQEDLELIADSNLKWDNLKNKHILVTGATGLIGSLLVRALLCVSRKRQLDVHVFALIRNEQKAQAIYGDLYNRKELTFIVEDITQIHSETFKNQELDYIIHTASVTTSKLMVEKPVETIFTAVEGTRKILEIAREKNTQGVIYLSSMEMYGDTSVLIHPLDKIGEEDIGYLNPMKVRSNYPESKRLCENMCLAYFREYGVPVKIARLAQTFGPGVLYSENRVFAQFARSVIYRKDIVLHTQGKSEGNYCYTRDLIIALFILLFRGINGEAYNIANESAHMTIADMAKMVVEEVAENKIKVVYDIPDENIHGYAPDVKLKLNNEKIKKLGWEPQVGLKEAYQRLIQSMEFIQ
jgi:UDP-glucuronate decarboxylase